MERDWEAPLNRLLRGFTYELRERELAFVQRDPNQIYIWNKNFVADVKWFESLEWDGWEVFAVDSGLRRFESDRELRRWLLECHDALLAEAGED
jgi:predicted NAD-dependent protein-ADP-ribosyltransferase YbiA (DUF1768 family)